MKFLIFFTFLFLSFFIFTQEKYRGAPLGGEVLEDFIISKTGYYSLTADRKIIKHGVDQKQLWSIQEEQRLLGYAILDQQENLYYFTRNNYFHKINTQGTKEWSINLRNRPITRPIYSSEGYLLLFTASSIYTVTPRGAITHKAHNPFKDSKILINMQGYLFGLGEQNAIIILNPWLEEQVRFNLKKEITEFFIGAESSIYTLNQDGTIISYAFSGALLWEQKFSFKALYALASKKYIYILGEQNLAKVSLTGKILQEVSLTQKIKTYPKLLEEELFFYASEDSLVAVDALGILKMEAPLLSKGNFYTLSPFSYALSAETDWSILYYPFKAKIEYDAYKNGFYSNTFLNSYVPAPLSFDKTLEQLLSINRIFKNKFVEAQSDNRVHSKNMIKSMNGKESELANIFLLLELAKVGVFRVYYYNGVLINDQKDVLIEAYAALGKSKSPLAKDFLIKSYYQLNDHSTKLEILKALGVLGYDFDGKTLRLITNYIKSKSLSIPEAQTILMIIKFIALKMPLQQESLYLFAQNNIFILFPKTQHPLLEQYFYTLQKN